DTMAISRDGKVTGFVNWMATHATTLPTENKLISSDNKGYAEYLDEVKEAGVDYTKLDSPSMVAAYVYSNGGDQTPNLGLKPATGPSSDPF
ncbi:neutral/alkaline non-lysosomal ceramidase N-terminal domain-containing protein, partial [Aerococcus urinae]